MSIKPINFRPKPTDQALIDTLMTSTDYDNQSDLIRQAIFQLAQSKFGKEGVNKILIDTMYR